MGKVLHFRIETALSKLLIPKVSTLLRGLFAIHGKEDVQLFRTGVINNRTI
jgi:hypothetical protein